jgi:hypothetical protein
MFQFPPSPAVGQEFSPMPGVVYRWNGTAWFLIVGPPAPSAIYTTPAQATEIAITEAITYAIALG